MAGEGLNRKSKEGKRVRDKLQNRQRYIVAGLLIIAAAMFFAPIVSYKGNSVSMGTVVSMLGKLKKAGGFLGDMFGLEDELGNLGILANMRILFCIPYLFALATALINLFIPEKVGRLATVIVGAFNMILLLGAVILGGAKLEGLLGEWMFALDMMDISIWKLLGIGFWFFLACQLLAVILSVASIAKKDSVSEESCMDTNTSVMEVAPEPKVQEDIRERTGSLQGLKGEYAGMRLTIRSGEDIVIGRDSRVCNLVLTNPKISRRHCAISYFPETDRYTLTDFSSTGTFYAGGKRIQPNSTIEVMSGTVIALGDQENTFRIG